MKSWRDEARQILAALESEGPALAPPKPPTPPLRLPNETVETRETRETKNPIYPAIINFQFLIFS